MISVDKNKCISCGGCVAVCPVTALELRKRYPFCNEKCTDCKICIKFCPVNALSLVNE